MALKLKNRWTYKGDDRWKWEAFIDDDGTGELAEVEAVEYILHPTYPDPIRRVIHSEGGFALKTEGWGEFDLGAFVKMKDGSKKSLHHMVKLESDPPTGVTT